MFRCIRLGYIVAVHVEAKTDDGTIPAVQHSDDACKAAVHFVEPLRVCPLTSGTLLLTCENVG